MPQAVTHFIIPALLAAFFRVWYNKRHRPHIPLHYVFFAGLAGLLPDFDIGVIFILKILGLATDGVHRTFTHSLIFPLIFVVLAIICYFVKYNPKWCERKRMKLSTILWIVAFGTFMHIFLDATIDWYLSPFLPFSNYQFGLNLFARLPSPLNSLAIPTLDAILFILWLVYLEVKHKISDFI